MPFCKEVLRCVKKAHGPHFWVAFETGLQIEGRAKLIFLIRIDETSSEVR